MIETIPTLCGSVAGKPSPLGVKLHNAAFSAGGHNFTYVAMGTDDIDEALSLCRIGGFRGLGVSMPHKSSVISRLDWVDDDVKAIGSCNTVVFDESGATRGYNTDWIGARDSLREAGIDRPTRAAIVGSGGVARAISYALTQMDCEVVIVARNRETARALSADLNLEGNEVLDPCKTYEGFDLVVNATPDASESSPVQISNFPQANALFDVVFNTIETDLIASSRQAGFKVAPGWRMLLLQAVGQSRLYTGFEPDVAAMSNVLEAAFGK